MGTVVPLFSRQTAVGADAQSVSYLSEPYEASQYDSINVEFRVFGLIGTAPTIYAYLETAAELHSASWTTSYSFPSLNSAPTVLSANLANTDMSQFVRAKVVINAAGPWVDAVRLMCNRREKPRLTLTKGIHLVFRQEKVPISRVVMLRGNDKRFLFAIPHGTVTYVGTTDTFYDRPDDYPTITLDDTTYVLDAIQRTLSVPPLTPQDVIGAWAGLRPLLAEEGKAPSEISRRTRPATSCCSRVSPRTCAARSRGSCGSGWTRASRSGPESGLPRRRAALSPPALASPPPLPRRRPRRRPAGRAPRGRPPPAPGSR